MYKKYRVLDGNLQKIDFFIYAMNVFKDFLYIISMQKDCHNLHHFCISTSLLQAYIHIYLYINSVIK